MLALQGKKVSSHRISWPDTNYLELLDVTDGPMELPLLLLLGVIVDSELGLYGESRWRETGGELVLDPFGGGLFIFLGRFF